MHDPYLAHYGIKGMKWGVRRYQNEDGSLTEAGKKRKKQEDSPGKKDRIKTGLKIAGGVAATAAVAYGAYRYSKFVDNKATKLHIAKGKAIIDDYLQHGPIPAAPNFAMRQAMKSARAASAGTAYVNKAMNEKNLLNNMFTAIDYRKIQQKIKNGDPLSDIEKYWKYYVEHPDKGYKITVNK